MRRVVGGWQLVKCPPFPPPVRMQMEPLGITIACKERSKPSYIPCSYYSAYSCPHHTLLPTQMEPLGITIACKERSKRTMCPLVMLRPSVCSIGGGGDGGGGTSAASSLGAAAAAASAVEPFTAYLKGGEWWLEFSRLLTVREAAAAGDGGDGSRGVALPPGLVPEHELLRALQREHCRLADVCGEVAVLRTKKLPARLASAAGGALYQRYVWDMETRHVLTDAPASEFVLD